MATFDAAPGLPSVVDPDQQDHAGAYASLDQLAQLFAPLQQPPSTYVDFFTQLAATGTPPTSYQQSKANALNYAGVPVTSAYTAQPNQLVLVDASAASVPVTLPASPTVNDLVAVVVSALTAPNVVTVSANGKAFNIAGGAQTLTLPLLGEIGQFQYVGGGIWVAALMAPPGSVDPAGTAAALTAALKTTLEAEIQAVASRAVPPPRSTSISPAGQFVLGLTARGPVINLGYPVNGLRIRVDQSPTGGTVGTPGATFQVSDSAGNLYGTPYTIPYAASSSTPYSFDDPAAGGWQPPDGSQMKLNFTGIGSTFPGAGITVELVADFPPATIGADTALATTTIGGASVGFAWQYTGTATPGTHVIVAKLGTTAPTSPSDGITATVAGSATSGQVTGLAANSTYAAGVWPVASDGTLGTPTFLAGAQAFTTAAADTSPPGPVTSPAYAAGATAITASWTNPTDADFHHVIARIKINVTSPFSAIPNNTQPTEGHPAATTTPGGSGAGTALPAGATSFTQTNLTASTNYVIGLFTVDAAGNINGTPVSIVCATTPTATTGQGLTGQVPAAYSKAWPTGTTDPIQLQDLSAYVGSGQTQPGFQGYANAVEGPTARANVGTMVDPLLGAGHYCMFMKMQRLTTSAGGAWMDSTSSVYKNHQGWFTVTGSSPTTYVTNGVGYYGSRVQNFKAPSQAWGAWDIEWWIANLDGSVATAIGTHSKGLTIMLFPDANWPKREVDYVEIPSGFPQTNVHYQTSTGGNGQMNTTTLPSGLVLPNIFAPIKTTMLLEPPPAGDLSNGRLRVFHQQAGTAGGAVQCFFDTNVPYVGDNLTAAKVAAFLSQAQVGHIGLAVAYQASSVTYDKVNDVTGGANFSAATGTGTNQRTGHMALIRSITQWAAA